MAKPNTSSFLSTHRLMGLNTGFPATGTVLGDCGALRTWAQLADVDLWLFIPALLPSAAMMPTLFKLPLPQVELQWPHTFLYPKRTASLGETDENPSLGMLCFVDSDDVLNIHTL